jgi:5-methylcytosine-specific restriction endonuclease McrA
MAENGRLPLESPISRRTKASQVPLRVSFELYGIDVCRIHLIQLGQKPLALEAYWPTGLTPDLVEFITTQCRCGHCDTPISSLLDPCGCGRTEKRYALVAAFSRELARDTWLRIYSREAQRVNRWRREARIASGGGALSTRRVAQLLEVQERRCYFCASALINADGSRNFHRGHFEPLAHGGASTVNNIVLTCPSCNFKKNDMSGSAFEWHVKKLRSPESTAWLKEMRQRLVKWRASALDEP